MSISPALQEIDLSKVFSIHNGGVWKLNPGGFGQDFEWENRVGGHHGYRPGDFEKRVLIQAQNCWDDFKEYQDAQYILDNVTDTIYQGWISPDGEFYSFADHDMNFQYGRFFEVVLGKNWEQVEEEGWICVKITSRGENIWTPENWEIPTTDAQKVTLEKIDKFISEAQYITPIALEDALYR